MTRNFLILTLCVISSTAWGGLDTTPNLRDIIEVKEGGHSVAPVVGYEPTFGWLVGGAYFFEKDKFSLGFDTNTNFKQVYQFHSTVHAEFGDAWFTHFHPSITKGYQPYYGEGGDTKVENFSRLWGSNGDAKWELGYRLSPIYSIGIFSDVRFRQELPGGGPDSPKERAAPNEVTGGAGIYQQVDTRDNPRDPRDGFVFRTDLTYVPSKLTTVANPNDFGQVEGDLIVYQEVLKEIVRDMIAAFHLMGGYTLGTPTFAFKYHLGGADQLRGYLENRFRGKKYYLQQTELRFPIWKLFSGACFLGFGEATDTEFSSTKMSYGIGIRIGLPPDWISKVRIDFGVGRDQQGVFVDFGQTF